MIDQPIYGALSDFSAYIKLLHHSLPSYCNPSSGGMIWILQQSAYGVVKKFGGPIKAHPVKPTNRPAIIRYRGIFCRVERIP